MKNLPRAPEQIEVWFSTHLTERVELTSQQAGEEWARLRLAFGIARGQRTSLLEVSGSASVSLGRAGRRRWQSLIDQNPETIVIFDHYVSGWTGMLEVAESEIVSESAFGPFRGDVVLLHRGLEWIFVISDHLGQGLLQATVQSSR